MSDIVIEAHGLGKRYRIGTRLRYKTLRDSLADAWRTPFRALSRLLKPPSTIHHPPSTDSIWALQDVSFEVKRGEVVGIIGRNGAGKSTLLKILSGITEPTEGYADINGRVGSLLEIGTGFHRELTGRENIYLNGAILGMLKRDIDRKFDEIVAFAELERFLDTPVKHYSDGMYVRLGFAVAAHLEPDILMVDEVLAVGDYNFQRKCIQKIHQLSRELRTILFVSHDLPAVNLVAKRAILLDVGSIHVDGPPSQIIAAYLDSMHKLKVNQVSSVTESTSTKTAQTVLASLNPCQIVAVELLNQDRQPAQTFAPRSTLRVRIRYRASSSITNPYFGITLWTDDGIRICTLDSRLAPQVTLQNVVGEAAIECAISKLFLLPGAYLVRVRIYDPNSGWPYDSFGWDDGHLISFSVECDKNQRLALSRQYGIIGDIPVTWDLLDSNPPVG